MLSPNLALKKAYFGVLKNIVYQGENVPVFYGQIPSTVKPGIYISFSGIRNTDASNKTSSTTSTSVNVSIYTNSTKYNDGVAVDAVANEVLNRLYKNPQFHLHIDSFFQVITTQLTSDNTNDFSQNNQLVYIDRILTLTHTIFQNPS
jgi:hypothetical protein